MDDDRNSRSGSSGRDNRPKSEFQTSVERLEQAVQDLVGSATNEFTDRASTFVDELTDKIETEFRGTSRSNRSFSDSQDAREDLYDPDGAARRMRARRQARREARRAARRQSRQTPRMRSDRLYRDPSQAKIVGVCAGVARYYGVENWVVRCIAVTGLLFLPSIVFPAYWVAYFVLDTPPDEGRSRSRRPRPQDHSTSSPELGPDLAPRQSLRNVESDLTEVELRLRRMESHVTSGQYELQRELNKIDPGSNGTASEQGA